jgi:CHAT domain-containing protein
VDDQATGQLMVGFYERLKAGRRKDDALREAMLAVRGASDGRTAEPVFWAAFQVNGETAPLRKSTP